MGFGLFDGRHYVPAGRGCSFAEKSASDFIKLQRPITSIFGTTSSGSTDLSVTVAKGGEPTCGAAASRPQQSRLADVHARRNEPPTVIGASGGERTVGAVK